MSLNTDVAYAYDYDELNKIKPRSLRKLLQLYLMVKPQLSTLSRKELVELAKIRLSVSQSTAYDYANALKIIEPLERDSLGKSLESYLPEWLSATPETKKWLPKLLPWLIKTLNTITYKSATPTIKMNSIDTNMYELYESLKLIAEDDDAESLLYYNKYGEQILGGTLIEKTGGNPAHKIVARADVKEDSPIRATHIRTMTWMEDSFIRLALNYTSKILREISIDDNSRVSSEVGNLIRIAGSKFKQVKSKDLALACLTYLFTKNRWGIEVHGEVMEAKTYFKPREDVLHFLFSFVYGNPSIVAHFEELAS
jgi:hypothetical protein